MGICVMLAEFLAAVYLGQVVREPCKIGWDFDVAVLVREHEGFYTTGFDQAPDFTEASC